MRTTLTIDQDVLLAARDQAAVDGRTVGDVISSWARSGIATGQLAKSCQDDDWLEQQGIVLLPRRDALVTTADVARLQDELYL